MWMELKFMTHALWNRDAKGMSARRARCTSEQTPSNQPTEWVLSSLWLTNLIFRKLRLIIRGIAKRKWHKSQAHTQTHTYTMASNEMSTTMFLFVHKPIAHIMCSIQRNDFDEAGRKNSLVYMWQNRLFGILPSNFGCLNLLAEQPAEREREKRQTLVRDREIGRVNKWVSCLWIRICICYASLCACWPSGWLCLCGKTWS